MPLRACRSCRHLSDRVTNSECSRGSHHTFATQCWLAPPGPRAALPTPNCQLPTARTQACQRAGLLRSRQQSTIRGSSWFACSSRPHRSLFPLRHGLEPLVSKLLHAFPFVGLGRVEVALRVGRDAVNRVELAGLT